MAELYDKLETCSDYLEYKSDDDLLTTLQSSKLIGQGSFNYIYEYYDETVLLKSKGTINYDDIILFLYLNTVNEKPPGLGPFFTPLKKIIFTAKKNI